MSSVPMPVDLSEEAVAEWRNAVLREAAKSLPLGAHSGIGVSFQALRAYDRAVRALVREKVRLAADVAYDLLAAPWDPAEETAEQYGARHAEKHDAIVARVMGEEAPRA